MKKLPFSSFQFPVKAVLLLGVMVLTAFIPAKVPTNLDNTPGPAVVVTDKTFENGYFTARYPDGWRVVTSEAGAQPSVIFVAPDEVSTIQLLVGALDNANFNNPKVQVDVRSITLDDLQITAILSAAPTQLETLTAQFERVLASIKPV
jgi:hypothetical protein